MWCKWGSRSWQRARKHKIGWEFERHTLEELPQLQAQAQQGKILYTPLKITPNPTTQELKSQALELHTTAKEQEEGFKELLEGLKGGDSTLEANNTLKSVQSIEEKLAYYNGDAQRVDDLLRGL
ncbi:hypothetical protein [Helicobacter baculiformis]|uniref:hypothetical protein n=1 Tax=Helicobacter baculiformis TaxID=427351 RepID=UPI000CF0F369|nr:hypothetical protein [Helicobacter baculiformis]